MVLKYVLYFYSVSRYDTERKLQLYFYRYIHALTINNLKSELTEKIVYTIFGGDQFSLFVCYATPTPLYRPKWHGPPFWRVLMMA